MSLKQSSFVVIGLGETGLSCAHFLAKHKQPFMVIDSRSAPPNLAEFKRSFPHIPYYLNDWPQSLLNQATQIILSPGVSIKHPQIQLAIQRGVPVMGDIELFARYNKHPVVAITGSNGKSTVTTLLGKMAEDAGKKVAVLGNIGKPALDILMGEQPQYDLIVMELSSFQLETVESLRPLAATILNISPDHLDRYDHVQDYIAAKQRIYHKARNILYNHQDLNTYPLKSSASNSLSFTLNPPISEEQYGMIQKAGIEYLAKGSTSLMPINELKILGRHNIENALVALALGEIVKLPMDSMLQTLRKFSGLPHRCEWVATMNDIVWVNDSKGTNIGATIAALKGIGHGLSGKIILLLGGQGKGADFRELQPFVKEYCREVIVYGQDKAFVYEALKQTNRCHITDTLSDSLKQAKYRAVAGDVVLLSPACASWDQFKDYQHRGHEFCRLVKGLNE